MYVLVFTISLLIIVPDTINNALGAVAREIMMLSPEIAENVEARRQDNVKRMVSVMSESHPGYLSILLQVLMRIELRDSM